jgi:hypothetical protein
MQTKGIYQILSGWRYCRLCNAKLFFKNFMGVKYVIQNEFFTLVDDVYIMTCKKCHLERQ